mmetsp:Transcript_6608/g.19060  ORF Transcript_6608/g.19060 Transcript_6608/m.19060 type:complete len:313 (+) Transcript_6608:334-1272(+)
MKTLLENKNVAKGPPVLRHLASAQEALHSLEQLKVAPPHVHVRHDGVPAGVPLRRRGTVLGGRISTLLNQLVQRRSPPRTQHITLAEGECGAQIVGAVAAVHDAAPAAALPQLQHFLPLAQVGGAQRAAVRGGRRGVGVDHQPVRRRLLGPHRLQHGRRIVPLLAALDAHEFGVIGDDLGRQSAGARPRQHVADEYRVAVAQDTHLHSSLTGPLHHCNAGGRDFAAHDAQLCQNGVASDAAALHLRQHAVGGGHEVGGHLQRCQHGRQLRGKRPHQPLPGIAICQRFVEVGQQQGAGLLAVLGGAPRGLRPR